MEHVIQQVKKHLAAWVMLPFAAVLIGCSSQKNPYRFETAKDAVTCCHSKLSEWTAKKDVSISDLIKIVNDYLELKDSCYSIFLNDTTFDYRGELAVEYVGVTDSMQIVIINLAKEKPRTMTDIIDLRVGTATGRDKVIASKDYLEIENFYQSLDSLPILVDTRTTVASYLGLLKYDIPTDEKAMTAYLAKEDQCFRSLLKHFPDIPEEIVQNITENTVEVFNNLEDSLLIQKKMSSIEDRTMILMTMRLNRRIIQNATSCRQQIEEHRQLSKYTASNYRWMLMQPFIAIDQTSMAVITDEQIKSLKDIAQKLPTLLAELDGVESKKITSEEMNRLTEFFLNMYLKMIL